MCYPKKQKHIVTFSHLVQTFPMSFSPFSNIFLHIDFHECLKEFRVVCPQYRLIISSPNTHNRFIYRIHIFSIDKYLKYAKQSRDIWEQEQHLLSTDTFWPILGQYAISIFHLITKNEPINIFDSFYPCAQKM